MTTIIGAVLGGGKANERPRLDVTVTHNASGTWTASGPHVMRDFAKRVTAVRWIKAVFDDASNGAQWSE